MARARYLCVVEGAIDSAPARSLNPSNDMREPLLQLAQQLPPAAASPYCSALHCDLNASAASAPNEGELGLALSSNEIFKSWGGHYARSLLRAHQLQQCHNFKDPGRCRRDARVPLQSLTRSSTRSAAVLRLNIQQPARNGGLHILFAAPPPRRPQQATCSAARRQGAAGAADRKPSRQRGGYVQHSSFLPASCNRARCRLALRLCRRLAEPVSQTCAATWTGTNVCAFTVHPWHLRDALRLTGMAAASMAQGSSTCRLPQAPSACASWSAAMCLPTALSFLRLLSCTCPCPRRRACAFSTACASRPGIPLQLPTLTGIFPRRSRPLSLSPSNSCITCSSPTSTS